MERAMKRSARRAIDWKSGAGAGLAILLASSSYAQDSEFGPPRVAAGAGADDAGKAAYARNCGSCHGGGLNDGPFGPPLKGAAFEEKWKRDSDALLAYVAASMPPGGGGSLGAQTYRAVTAYIAAANNFPALKVAAQAAPAPRAGPAAPAAGGAGRAPPPAPRDDHYNRVIAQRQQKMAAITPVTAAMLASPPAGEWLNWRRTLDGLGHSPLAGINKANVGGLANAWSWSLPISQNEITPIVHDGIIFLESGVTVQALDAVTGDLMWQYVRSVSEELDNGRRWRIKSMAIYGERLYVPTVDGHIVALDVHTGKVVWDHDIVGPAGLRNGGSEAVGYLLTGGPIVAEGKVVVGVSLGQNQGKGGCYIVALDAGSGDEQWRFNTIARPGEPGGDSWNGHPLDERYGAGVWTPGSYDPQRHLVYFGTGNTYDTATLLEPDPTARPSNDGLYTNTTLALDINTGKLAWHFQHVNREVWDLDWVYERSLLTMPINGKPTDVVITGGKIALFDAMDRATGKYLFSVDLGLQNLVVGVDPVTGRKTINPELEPKVGKTALMCPNTLGARNWPATAINPNSRIMYIPMAETCADYTYSPRDAAATRAGGSDIRTTRRFRPDSDGLYGRLAAVDLTTRKVLWTKRQRGPFSSAILSTAGGLIFSGSRDRTFQALDERTGQVLWETRLSASPSSFPITYSVGGEQYVAVVAGGGGPLDANGLGNAPEIENPAEGVTLNVFKLPKRATR